MATSGAGEVGRITADESHGVDSPCQPPGPEEVHVWRFKLDLSADLLVVLEHFLGLEEKERADRFNTAQLRNRFIAARGLLRVVLGRYLGHRPESLSFSYGPQGKPFLVHRACSLEFNLAHSEGNALLAVAQQSVGIDLEHLRNDLDIPAMAALVFTPDEQTELQSASAMQRDRHFFTTWVRKEAYMKATGLGFSQNPAEFAVWVDAVGLTVVHIGEAPRRSLVRLYDLTTEDIKLVAALAVEGLQNHRISYFTWRRELM